MTPRAAHAHLEDKITRELFRRDLQVLARQSAWKQGSHAVKEVLSEQAAGTDLATRATRPRRRGR